ncbi:MAG: DUF4352 domain-containing protein [Bryobacteraceae bacterium]
MIKRRPLPLLILLLSAVAVLSVTGCKRQSSTQINYQMGERIVAGPMVYNVVQTVWKTQLGDLFQLRTPENRFLVITLSATNSGGKEVSIPFLTLEGQGAKEFKELQDGTGVERWFGVLRTIQPAETRQGNVVFDVPLTSYRLRLTDGGELGTEKNVWVEIPLRMDTDTTIAAPTPGQQ